MVSQAQDTEKKRSDRDSSSDDDVPLVSNKPAPFCFQNSAKVPFHTYGIIVAHASKAAKKKAKTTPSKGPPKESPSKSAKSTPRKANEAPKASVNE